MPSRVDLHTHTIASDGRLSAKELIDKALSIGIRYLSITDHDSTDAYATIQPDSHAGLTLIPGIEINADADPGCHILGYFINIHDQNLQDQLARYRLHRHERAKAMIEKLNALGFPVSWEQVLRHSQNGSVGRPHIADALVENKIVRNRKEAFERFLKAGASAYVSGDIPTAAQAIELIRSVKGVAILAHPAQILENTLIERLMKAGLQGLEIYYPDYSRGLIAKYKEMAEKLNLLVTGGSDYHGPRTHRSALGIVDVPEQVVVALQNKC